LEWLLLIIRTAHEGDRNTALYCNWNEKRRVISTASSVTREMRLLMSSRTCCFRGYFLLVWRCVVVGSDAYLAVFQFCCIIGGWPCLGGG